MTTKVEDRSSQVLAVTVSLLVLTTCAIVLRMIARRIPKVSLGLDDWFIIFAWITFIAGCVCALVLYEVGLGRHMSTATMDLYSFAKTVWLGEFLYQVDVCLYKLSLVFMYYRIFVLKRFRVVLHLVAGLIGVYTIWSVLQTLLQCLPIPANWRFRFAPHPGDRCIPARATLLSLAVTNVILDWTLLFLPMPIIWKLKMSLIHKFEVSIVIGTGALVCVFSVIRMNVILSLSQTDITWNYTSLILWSMLETAMGIICPCLVTLRPILQLVFGRFYDPSSRQKTATTKNTTHTHVSHNNLSGPFHRMENSVDDVEVRVAYHTMIGQASERSESDMIPLGEIRVIKDVDVKSRTIMP